MPNYDKFKIIDVFHVNNTHCILSDWIVPNSGTTPYVTASEGNNAVSTFIEYNRSQIEEGNSIMIGGKTLVITYQSK
ncbi:MAG: restriction endonuclease subunit S, partial [Clostridiales Family XIII bacterium]|nr:restriction endonuclease subunit S [Clostridiales Family XIII bacterium]